MNDQMQRFINTVNVEIDKKVDHILKIGKHDYEKIINQANDDALKRAYSTMQDSVRKLEAKYSRIVSKAELEMRKNTIKKRDQLFEQLFENIKNSLEQFTESKDYYEYLKNHLSGLNKLTNDQTAVIYARTKDLEVVNNCVKECTLNGFTTEVDDTIKLGGFTVFYPNQSRLLDFTFDAKLQEERLLFHKKNVMPL